jgi:Ca-activated chloride channel family protein
MHSSRCFVVTLGLVLGAATSASVAHGQENDLTIQVAYGSEKKGWIEAVTKDFNAENHRVADGRRIHVKVISRGSGQMFEDINLDEETPDAYRHHLVSPAASAYVEFYNQLEQEKLRTAGKEAKPLVPPPIESLFNSPIVLMVWKDLAPKMGWGLVGRNPRWRDVFDYARQPAAWEQLAGPGKVFRLGHTHPFYSNSGFHALFLEAYAAANSFQQGLGTVQLQTKQKEITDYLRQVEEAVPHYGESTGDLGRKMLASGPDYLSATVVYENSVFEFNRKELEQNRQPQVVAVYPEEGTFPSDHPIGAVDRPWVTEAHREAGQVYTSYLLDRPRQELAARKYGFRPRRTEIPISEILREDLGVDANQPTRLLKPPTGQVIARLRRLWLEAKRPCDVILAIDISGSMNAPVPKKGKTRIAIVKEEVPKFIAKFRQENDPSGGRFALILFGPGDPELIHHDEMVDAAGKDLAPELIKNIQPAGDTPLLQAVDLARKTCDAWPPPPNDQGRRRNQAVVVFSDGQDSRKMMTLDLLLKRISQGAKKGASPVPIHTIGFGQEAGVADPLRFLDDLRKISKASGGEFHAIELEPEAVNKVFEFIIMMY